MKLTWKKLCAGVLAAAVMMVNAPMVLAEGTATVAVDWGETTSFVVGNSLDGLVSSVTDSEPTVKTLVAKTDYHITYQQSTNGEDGEYRDLGSPNDAPATEGYYQITVTLDNDYPNTFSGSSNPVSPKAVKKLFQIKPAAPPASALTRDSSANSFTVNGDNLAYKLGSKEWEAINRGGTISFTQPITADNTLQLRFEATDEVPASAEYTHEAEKLYVTPTFNIPATSSYDGEIREASITGFTVVGSEPITSHTVDPSLYQIEYKGGTIPTWSTTAPKAAGTYDVRVALTTEGKNNYYIAWDGNSQRSEFEADGDIVIDEIVDIYGVKEKTAPTIVAKGGEDVFSVYITKDPDGTRHENQDIIWSVGGSNSEDGADIVEIEPVNGNPSARLIIADDELATELTVYATAAGNPDEKLGMKVTVTSSSTSPLTGTVMISGATADGNGWNSKTGTALTASVSGGISPAPNYTYKWYSTEGNVYGENDPLASTGSSFTPQYESFYYVEVTAPNYSGSLKSGFITVSEGGGTSNNPVITFSVNPGGSLNIAQNSTQVLYAQAAANPSTALTYTWYKVGANNVAETTGKSGNLFTIPSDTLGTFRYFVRVSASDTNFKDSNITTVVVGNAVSTSPTIGDTTNTLTPNAFTAPAAGSQLALSLPSTSTISATSTLTWDLYTVTTAGVETRVATSTTYNGQKSASVSVPGNVGTGVYLRVKVTSNNSSDGAMGVRTSNNTIGGSSTPVSSGVSISPNNTSIRKGSSLTFTATVSGASGNTVNWSIDGSYTSGTYLSSTSNTTSTILYISANETVSSLTLRATSTLNSALYGTATVNITSSSSSSSSYTGVQSSGGTYYDVNINSATSAQQTQLNNAEQDLKSNLISSSGNQVVYRVYLDINLQERNTSTIITNPNGSVTITIPYSRIGSGANRYGEYNVVHVKSNGAEEFFRDGDITKDDDGISFTVTSFSPFMVLVTPKDFNGNVTSLGTSGTPGTPLTTSGTTAGAASFWSKVENTIRNTSAGNRVRANAKTYDQVPVSVLTMLKNQPGITLEIAWDGGKSVSIPSAAVVEPETNRVYYPISKLIELYGSGSVLANSSGGIIGNSGGIIGNSGTVYDPTKPGYTTGGVWEVFAPDLPVLSSFLPTPANYGLEDTSPSIALRTLTQPSMIPYLLLGLSVLAILGFAGAGIYRRVKFSQK